MTIACSGTRGDDGVGLVGEGIGAVGTRPEVSNEVTGKGQPIEDVAKVNHEAGHGSGNDANARSDHPNGQKLHAPGVNNQGQYGSPPPRKSRLRNQQSKCEAEGDKTKADSPGIRKPGPPFTQCFT